ncbi:hypothetical protein CR513_02871, partial [Mucuna pruriens]
MEKEKDLGKRTIEGAKNKSNNRAHLEQDEGTNLDSEAVLLMTITSAKTQSRISIEEEEELTAAPVFNQASVDSVVNSEGELIHSALIAEVEPAEFDKAMTEEKWLKAMKEEIKLYGEE